MLGTSPDHCNMAGHANGATSMVAANNVFSYMECSGGEILWLSGHRVVSGSNWYAYNNLFYQVASGGAQRITTCTHPTGVNCGTYWLFNNTDSNSGGQLSGNGETRVREVVGDPGGSTTSRLKDLEVSFQPITADARLDGESAVLVDAATLGHFSAPAG